MSALLLKHIPDEFRWEKYRGSFDDVKTYLLEAYNNALIEFANSIKSEYFRKELKQIVEYLCFPFPDKRGHPKNISSIGSNYSLERFISRLDLLRKKAEYKIKKNGNNN